MWRGLSEIVVDGQDQIVSSVVKMNQFYLSRMGAAVWQYTLCHEIGHSLGLKHTDENFENIDLRSCMDYTNNFKRSKHPDETNYETLVSMYGAVSNRRLRSVSAQEDTRSNYIQKKHTELVEKLLEKREIAHLFGWRLIHKKSYGEEYESVVGSGCRLRVHLLLTEH